MRVIETRHIERPVMLPSEIIASAQAKLFLSTDVVVDDILCVLEDARDKLYAYFFYRSASGFSNAYESDPVKAELEIATSVNGILLGVMCREAVFAALSQISEGPHVFVEVNEVDYTTAFVDEYSRDDGEHQFMKALVSLLDGGLLHFYRQPGANAFRLALRDASKRLTQAQFVAGKFHRAIPSCIEIGFDEWTIDADKLFVVDVHDVRDRVRRALRHNAETVMLFVRLFPASILDAYERERRPLGVFRLTELQHVFFHALPTMLIQSSIRLKRELSEDPKTRHSGTLQSDQLICELGDRGISGFHWSSSRLKRQHRGGRCPANASLPALSRTQQDFIGSTFIGSMGETNALCCNSQDVESWTMSTAEALFRLAIHVVPELWQHQYEAHMICSDIRDGKWKEEDT